MSAQKYSDPVKRRERGLTVLEILVASGLLSVVLVTIMVLFTQILHNTEKNALLSAGTYFAESLIEEQITAAKATLEAANGNNSVNAFPPTPIEGSKHLSTADVTPSTEFFYQIDSKRIDGLTATDLGQLWSIKVNVHWYGDKNNPQNVRSGYGNLFVERTRLAYVTGVR